MKYVSEFRDPVAAKSVLAAIARVTDALGATAAKPVHIMEICGGHTHAIFRYGLDKLVPAGIEFIHGPGCPVCVLPRARVDEAIQLAERPGVIFATFGDAMRVPGTGKSLMQARAAGADVRMVYSPLDALELARRNPAREVVFFGLGFETTTPSTAITVQAAAAEGLTNFSLFCNHITVPEPIKALWDAQPGRLRVLLLGSSALQIQAGVTESLAGRFELLRVHHWTFAELQTAFDYNLPRYLAWGGYPGAVAVEHDPDRWYAYMKDAIVEAVIGKDILQSHRVTNPALFRQAFQILCAYPAQEISYTKLLGQLLPLLPQ